MTLLKIAENGFAAAFRKNVHWEANNSEHDRNPNPSEEAEAEKAEVSTSCARRATPPSCSVKDKPQLNTSPLPSTPSGKVYIHTCIHTGVIHVFFISLSLFPPDSNDENDDNEDDDEDDIYHSLDPSIFSDYSDIPAHLRPVLFQPQHYCGLHRFTYTTLAYKAHHALTSHHNCNEAPPQGYEAVDQKMWWNKDARFADNVDINPELDLIFDFVAAS